MAITAIAGAGTGKLKLTETLKNANSYNWGGTTVTTGAKHKYVLGVINYQQFNDDGGRSHPMKISFSAGEEVVANQKLEDGSTTNMAQISLFRNVPAGTEISFQKSTQYVVNMYFQAYCFD